MKKILIIILGASLFYSCGKNNHQKQQTNQLSHIETDCSNLSQEQQVFAKKLSPLHKAIFCNYFNDSQRKEAIEISEKSEKMKSRGKTVYHVPISPDAAVERVIRSLREEKSNRDTARAYYNLY